MKRVADRPRLAAYRNKNFRPALGVLTMTTLNDLTPSFPPPKKIGDFSDFFLPFFAGTYTSRVNCEEMARDKAKQYACEIFSIKHIFH